MGQIENLTITRKKRITIATLYYPTKMNEPIVFVFHIQDLMLNTMSPVPVI